VRALEAIASGFPVKVLIQTDDILGDTSPEPPRTSFGGGSARLAAMALGVNNAYVFQGTSSSLCRLQERVLKGLVHDGPALFSIFSGAAKTVSGVPTYLLAAAAMESRAFPTFTYDPSVGPDWASRFDISDNPQVESDWPVHTLSFEDEEQQRITETVPFTHADFTLCDSRYARHWVPASRSKWSDAMIPAGEYMAAENPNGSESAPYVWTIDKSGRIRRTVLDDRMIDAARRCKETWRGLQELGGINNSHARRQVAQAREVWEKERGDSLPEACDEAPAQPQQLPPLAAPPPAVTAEPTLEPDSSTADAPSPGEPWIETARCTTCNECTQINNKMFEYNENKQAYIADPNAGTYRQMVEAAESCQVSIIHPGKPRDPGEPNLDELIERAEPFN
jgi:ferredoxin